MMGSWQQRLKGSSKLLGAGGRVTRGAREVVKMESQARAAPLTSVPAAISFFVVFLCFVS